MPEGEITIDDPRADDVRELLERHLAFAHLHSPPEDVHALDVDGLVDSGVTFFSFRLKGELLGVGALKRLDGRHAEVKSMHVAQMARGRGIGRAMLEHLLDVARERGFRRVSLETGSMPAFAEARSLYASAGFRPCGPFGDYGPSPNSTLMTLSLNHPARARQAGDNRPVTEQDSRMPPYIREAERLGHNGIGCEHLLLGILADQEGLAAKVLRGHGVTLEAARRRTAEIIGDGWQDSVRWTNSPRATVVRRLAEVEAERLGQSQPGDAHTLLAMITEGGGVPIQILTELGVNLTELREELVNALGVPDEEREMYLRQRAAYEAAQRSLRDRSAGGKPAELTPQGLIAAALAEPADGHEHWEHVSALRRRGDEATFQAAAEILDSPEPGRRALAAAILGQLGAEEGVPVEARPFRRPAGELLVARIESEKHPEVLAAFAFALGHLQEERAVPGLHALRRHPDPGVRHAVVSGLMGLDDDLAVATLIELSRDREAEVRDWATFGLGTQLQRDDDLIRSALLARIGDSDETTRAEALRGLATRGEERAIAPLLLEFEREMGADDPGVLFEALFALTARTGDRRLCRAVELYGRPWQAEQQPSGYMADALEAALDRCETLPGGLQT
ncbi:MAG: GNAT family N-acetyltransferase [Actinomycetota bacterium]|nr:GNAT family N-acetyltransferase [Actinomycetota bacterium]